MYEIQVANTAPLVEREISSIVPKDFGWISMGFWNQQALSPLVDHEIKIFRLTVFGSIELAPAHDWTRCSEGDTRLSIP